MKESKAFKVMDMAGASLITHDDRLMLRAQKSDIKLEADWKDQVDISYADGRPAIVDYWRTGQDGEPERASIEDYEAMDWREKTTWAPQYLRGLKLADGVSVSFKNNQVDLIICNLMNDWRSRYRMALEYMVELTERGVIRYRPTAEGDDRNRLEAIRNRLKRYGRPTEYEHDVLLKGELGRRIMVDLKESAIHAEAGSTYYLQGYNRTADTRLAIKYYDIGHREGVEDGLYFKLETTLLKKYFKSNGLTVSAMTEQPAIQELMLDDLIKALARIVGRCSWEVQTMMAQALSIEVSDRRKAPAMIARAMLRTERTLTERVSELERRMAQHDRDMAQHDRDIEALKRATGVR